ncbi:MAG: ABC transporter ATP-binding protein [Chloroflexi bacterium]|nr:ABC transporter ATP-binding protein [Chloroflexota bacterium]
MEPLLEVKGLRTEFPTREGVVHAVNGISYTVMPGEAVGIVGESGCGKSISALSIINLVPKPGRIAAGEVLFEGKNLLTYTDEEIRKVRGNDIAIIFQDAMTSLNPVLTVLTQLTEPLVLHMGMDMAGAERRAVEIMEMVEIPFARTRIRDYPHNFSGGMRQRVMIAMALTCDPKLVICDEPTTALDVTIQAQILDLLNRLRQDLAMAVIMITHDLGIVAGLCDRINVMYAGYIVEKATTEALFANPRHPYTLGLLRSIPRINQSRRVKLIPIDGFPPDLTQVGGASCPFQPRCVYPVERCEAENPPLDPVEEDHWAACWVDVYAEAGKERVNG